MDNKFVHLHTHSHFSMLDGLCKIDDLFKTASNMGFKSLAITDHGNCDAYVQALQKAKEYNVNYIPGTELYIVDRLSNIKNVKQNHLIVLAKNNKGLSELFKILGAANENFYRKPLVDFNLLSQFDFSNLIISTACLAGVFRFEDYEKKIEYVLDNITDELFFEVMPHLIEDQKDINEKVLKASKKYNKYIIATNDAHYIEKSHKKTHEILLAINSRDVMSNPNRFKFSDGSYHLYDEKYFIKAFKEQGVFKKKQVKSFLDNTNIINDMIDFKSFGSHDIKMNLKGYSLEKFLKVIKNRFKKIKNSDKKEYKDRLNRELNMIIDKGYDSYFYIVYDMVNFAKDNNIFVGPGRGSAAGSLLSYVLGVTSIDPIKFKLHFERFISEDRIDLPDIDLDFEDTRRDEVIKYLSEKYGDDKVSGIVTHIDMKARTSIRDVSRVYEVSSSHVDTVCKSMDEFGYDVKLKDNLEVNETLQEYFKQYKKISKHFMNLEGVIKTSGVHPAGHVISNKSINKSGRGYLVKRGDKRVLNWNMNDGEKMGFIKFDLLGLNTLSVLSNCLDLIKERHNKIINLDEIKLDDDEVFNLFSNGDTIGVFQFYSYGMRRLLQKSSIEKFNDIVALNALFRPGTLRSGITEEYINLKNGLSEPHYYSKKHRKVTKDTYGLIVFQEQLTGLLVSVGFSYLEADKIRKICSKKKGLDEIKPYKVKFIKRAKNKFKISEKDASELFDKIQNFALYVFNLSHATAYSMIAYWTAYMKVHHYQEFMQALLSYGQEDKLELHLNDLIEHDYELQKVDINKSEAINWKVIDGKIYLPFIAILGVGEKTANEIIRARKYVGKFKDELHFVQNIDKRLINKRIMELLRKTKAFKKKGTIKDLSLYKFK